MKPQAVLKCCKKKRLLDSFKYSIKPAGETDFGIKKYFRKYKRCTNCKHMFSYFNFNLENLYLKKYSKKAYGDLNNINSNFKKIISLPEKNSDNKNRVKRCQNFLKKKDKILDIGCGLGVFLFELKKKGYKINGIEPDQHLYKHSKKILGRNIFNGNLQSFIRKNKDISFNFISLNKVLEHVCNPKKIIAKLPNLMRKNAYLYIEVPDEASSKKGKNREELFVEHLHVFSKKSLSNLLSENGFLSVRVKRILEPSGKYTIYGLFQNLKYVK